MNWPILGIRMYRITLKHERHYSAFAYQCIEVAVGSSFVGLEKILFQDQRSLVDVALLRVGVALLGVGVALLPVATVLRSDMVLMVRGNVVLLIR